MGLGRYNFNWNYKWNIVIPFALFIFKGFAISSLLRTSDFYFNISNSNVSFSRNGFLFGLIL